MMGSIKLQHAQLLLVSALLAGGCVMPGSGASGRRAFTLGMVAKSDIDMVTDRVIEASFADLEQLMGELYRRNPREWQKTGIGPYRRSRDMFRRDAVPVFRELGAVRDLDALRLSLGPGYPGDRVLAFVFGLKTMILSAYGDRTDFYLLDELDPQALYNSARNLETAAWKLTHATGARGTPILVWPDREDDALSTGLQRLFGKLIARQDMMSTIVADKTNRRVKTAVQGVATSVFLPVL